MYRKHLALLLLLGCADEPAPVGPGPAPSDTDPPSETDGPTWDARFDPLVAALRADLAASDAPAVSVAILDRGEVVFAVALGSGHPDRDEAITPDTLFQIGSTTKVMTATTLLQKAADGDVDLDDTLATHLPDLDFVLDPSWPEQITLHHLLSHQGAFVDAVPWDGPSDDGELADWTYEVFDDAYYVMNTPGVFWNYANPNFSFAGLVAQTHDDRMWPDVLREDVLIPLGMDRSYVRKQDVEADGDYATGFGYVDPITGIFGTAELDDVPDPAWVRPAGMVWSTPSEMVRFAEFLMHGDASVLADEQWRALSAPQVDMRNDYGGHYGYGLMVLPAFLAEDQQWLTPVYTHAGNTLSFSSEFWMLPEQDFAISILSSGWATDFSQSLFLAITTLPTGLPEPMPLEEPAIDPSAFDRHVGTYLDPFNIGELRITREDDRLFAWMPLLRQLGMDVQNELITVSTHQHWVTIDGVPYDLTFIPEVEDGDSHWVRNRAFVATREAPSAMPPAAPDVTRADIERLLRQARMR